MEEELHACVLDFERSRETHFPLIKFAYNNSCHLSIGIVHFEAFYGRLCHSALCWEEVGYGKLFGPIRVRETNEKINVVRKKVKVAQSRRKSYTNQRCKDLESMLGTTCILKLSSTRRYRVWSKKRQTFTSLHWTF